MNVMKPDNDPITLNTTSPQLPQHNKAIQMRDHNLGNPIFPWLPHFSIYNKVLQKNKRLSDGMACHSPALEKAKKQGKMPLLPSHSKK